MKELFLYFKANNTEFDVIHNEVHVKRDAFNDDIRTVAIDAGLNIFELDTIIVIF